MKAFFFSLLLFGTIAQNARAQLTFVPQGKVTFEKRVNMQRSSADWNIPNEAKENIKKYRTTEWELYFDQTKSRYKAKKKERENDNPLLFLSINESENELFTDFLHDSRIIKKSILGDDYLLKDTIPKVYWKIMHDLRTIAGYECRKAVGIINDTVYVVAFYSEEILLKGGPEGFSGLPGLILGLAIPRLNTTWFASSVDAYTSHTEQIAAPFKGRKTETEKDLQKLLEIYSRHEGNKFEKPEDVKKRIFGFLL